MPGPQGSQAGELTPLHVPAGQTAHCGGEAHAQLLSTTDLTNVAGGPKPPAAHEKR